MLLDLLSQIEPDDSWRPVYPNPQPRPYPPAAYALASAPLLFEDSRGLVGPSGKLQPGRVHQYMAAVGPLFTGAVVTVTLDWLPELPQPTPAPVRAAGWIAFTPVQPAAPDRSWAPSFPDSRPPRAARAAYQPGTSSLVVDTTTGQGPGPSGLLWAGRVRQYMAAVGPLFVETPGTVALDWYPDLPPLRFLQRRADGWYALDPFPRPPADLLSAWAIFPDRLNRVTLPPALMPSFFYGTWEPIPNPPTTLVLEDRVLLGQNQSIETPFYPSIGGSTTWT